MSISDLNKALEKLRESLNNPQTFKAPAKEDLPEIELSCAEDSWIWVTGYKGTDANMCCRGYPYEFGKQFDMPEDAPIVDCESGFHLCRDLSDVYYYYGIGGGNRFFEVKALVRAKDYMEYARKNNSSLFYPNLLGGRNKLSAKSIEFVRELTVDEVFGACNYGGLELIEWTDEEKREAMATSLDQVKDKRRAAKKAAQIVELTSLGYSPAFAGYLVENDKYEVARDVASQPDLSMDMKCLIIFRHDL